MEISYCFRFRLEINNFLRKKSQNLLVKIFILHLVFESGSTSLVSFSIRVSASGVYYPDPTIEKKINRIRPNFKTVHGSNLILVTGSASMLSPLIFISIKFEDKHFVQLIVNNMFSFSLSLHFESPKTQKWNRWTTIMSNIY